MLSRRAENELQREYCVGLEILRPRHGPRENKKMTQPPHNRGTRIWDPEAMLLGLSLRVSPARDAVLGLTGRQIRRHTLGPCLLGIPTARAVLVLRVNVNARCSVLDPH